MIFGVHATQFLECVHYYFRVRATKFCAYNINLVVGATPFKENIFLGVCATSFQEFMQHNF